MNQPTYGWGLPPNLSSTGAAVDHLMHTVHWFMLVLFVGWAIFFVYCLIRFRSRPGHKASYELTRSKMPKVLEVAVVIFEAFLLVGLSFPLWTSLKSNLPAEKDSLVIRIVAQQFMWNFQYPGQDGKLGRADLKFITDTNPLGIDPGDPAGKDDFTTINELHFPVHKPVIAHVTSKDVIHSFAIPVLRVKQDANPGMTVPIWWEANGTGQFEMVCNQLCGTGHSIMRGDVSIDTPEDFSKWVATQSASLTHGDQGP